jgi:hypothetical protein
MDGKGKGDGLVWPDRGLLGLLGAWCCLNYLLYCFCLISWGDHSRVCFVFCGLVLFAACSISNDLGVGACGASFSSPFRYSHSTTTLCFFPLFLVAGFGDVLSVFLFAAFFFLCKCTTYHTLSLLLSFYHMVIYTTALALFLLSFFYPLFFFLIVLCC